MPAAGPPNPKFPARGSRPETENKGLAGSQARTMPATGPPTSKHPAEVRARKPKTKGSRGVEREPCRPPGLQTRNSRPEVRARKPKTKGLRGVKREPCRPPDLQPRNTRPRFAPGNRKQRVRGESSANHAGRRAAKPETPGRPPGPLCLPEDLQVCPAGPSHFRRTRPGRRARFASQRAGSQQKNTGRPPGVYSYPINPIIPAIPADSGRFPRILPGTLSAAEALLRCPPRGWLPRSAEAPDRAGTSAGGTNRCGRSDRN